MPQSPLLGNRISLISKKNIRYEGTLYSINEADATVALADVKSYGTEGRDKSEPLSAFVPPQDAVHPYLLFRGCDIKDLHVHEQQDEELDAAAPAEPAKQQQASAVAAAAPKAAQSTQQRVAAVDTPLPPPAAKDDLLVGSKKDNSPAASNVAPKPAPAPAPAPKAEPKAEQKAEQKSSAESKAPARSEEEVKREPKAAFQQHTNTVPKRQPSNAQRPNGASAQVSRQQHPQPQRQHNSQYHRGGYNNNSHRRSRKNESRVGTGASLLNRKERGAVDIGANPAKPGNDFDFVTSSTDFQTRNTTDVSATSPYPETNAESCYSKDDFFDSISCDTLDKQSGYDTRLRGSQERSLNTETFGAVSLGSGRRGGRRRGRGNTRNYAAGRGGGREANGGAAGSSSASWRKY